MFFLIGHRDTVIACRTKRRPDVVADLAADADRFGIGLDRTKPSFGYLFPDAEAPAYPATDDIDAKLCALAEAMQQQVPEAVALTGALPPIFTYLGQFIDHDICVSTDANAEASMIGDVPLAVQPRNDIGETLQNGRNGSLGLDSLYGDVPEPDDRTRALQAAMRDGPFLREGMAAGIGARPDLPRVGGDDLPRIGALVDAGVLDPDLLPAGIRPDGPGDDRRALAFIGDGRNDESLIISQLHVAFIRFHNAVARKILADARAALPDEAVYRLARQNVTWTYQWIVLNEYLPAVCRSQDVEAVIRAGAPLYSRFLQRMFPDSAPDLLPLPLEFAAAAFRFGHTMVRDAYDFNRTYGRPDLHTDGLHRADLRQLLQFTGRPVDGADPFGPFAGEVLPHNWLIEWDRFVASRPLFADRLARAIDTHLAPGMCDLENEPGALDRIFKNLALRNLRRGYSLNLPSGQVIQTAMQSAGIALGPVMAKQRLTDGLTGAALINTGLDEATPLWFYVLKEAEEMEAGARLGTVGSHLVADTIFGLIKHDPRSFWHAPGMGPRGRWHPSDGVRPNGVPVTSIRALLEAAGVLEQAPTSARPEPDPAAVAGRGLVAAGAPTQTGATKPSETVAPVDEFQVRKDVATALDNTYKQIDPDYAEKGPTALYGADWMRWSVSFSTQINVPLTDAYPLWAGLNHITRKRIFAKSFNEIFEITVASIMETSDR